MKSKINFSIVRPSTYCQHTPNVWILFLNIIPHLFLLIVIIFVDWYVYYKPKIGDCCLNIFFALVCQLWTLIEFISDLGFEQFAINSITIITFFYLMKYSSFVVQYSIFMEKPPKAHRFILIQNPKIFSCFVLWKKFETWSIQSISVYLI